MSAARAIFNTDASALRKINISDKISLLYIEPCRVQSSYLKTHFDPSLPSYSPSTHVEVCCYCGLRPLLQELGEKLFRPTQDPRGVGYKQAEEYACHHHLPLCIRVNHFKIFFHVPLNICILLLGLEVPEGERKKKLL